MTPEERDDAMFECWKGLLARLSDIDRDLGCQRMGISPHEPPAVLIEDIEE
jgi:hypothetical protein